MTTSDAEPSGGDPLIALLREQIQAQREVSKAMTQYAEAIARWQSDMGGMKRTADDCIRALDRATAEQEARRLAEEARQKREAEQRIEDRDREGRLYDVAGRAVESKWAAALGGGIVLWILQRLGVAVDTSALPDVAP